MAMSFSADSDAESDTSSNLTEIQQDEYPAYFEERHHTLFPSHGGPYMLPVDGYEQRRWKIDHNLLKALIGNNYVGPVRDILSANDSQTRIRALDLCTGTGRWVVKMAREFPRVRFKGLDIVPITPRHSPRNVRFEVGDVSQPFRYQDGRFDLVHARQLPRMTDGQYRSMLYEVSRVLRPGGLFLMCEWAHSTFVSPSHPVPATMRYYAAINECMRAKGIPELAPGYIVDLLQRTNSFELDIEVKEYVVPIGTWSSEQQMIHLGAAHLRSFKIWMKSMRPFLREGGFSGSQINSLIRECKAEIEETRGICRNYYAIWATRRM